MPCLFAADCPHEGVDGTRHHAQIPTIVGDKIKFRILDSLSPRRRKLLFWILGLLLFYTILGFLILPPLIRSVAVKQLSKQLDREVTIQKVKLNPFALSCTVRGLLIKDKDGEPFVSWDEVYVNFQLSSFFGKAWVFKEISTTKPFVRVQMNKDYTFNFSDLITKFSTNAPGTAPQPPSKPLVLHIDRLRIGGATAALADFTMSEPFKRTLGPLDITLDNFRTDPDNKNPYAFAGTTDAGETISWRGFFYLDPLRSQGELKLFNFTLNKYAPLYQDLVRFEIRDGSIALDAKYQLELSATNRVAAVHDTAFALRDFKLGRPGDSNNIAELPLFAVTGASADLESRQATVDSVKAVGGKLFLSRNQDESINVVELSQPSEAATNAPGGILFLLRSVTNAVALLLNSTNQWSGTVASVNFTNCALHLEDLAFSRPAKLDLTDIALSVKNISNVPGTNLTAELSLRWNTDGSIKLMTTASFLPPTADLQLDLDQLDLGTLDPYLEPRLNLFILGSRLGLHGQVHLRTPKGQLPEVTFHGDASLDDFHTVDGVMAEDLLKWDSVRINGIDANLNPQTVAIREIAVDNAYARFVIETNRTINLLNALRLMNTNAPATNETKVAIVPKPAATNSALPRISIASVVISNTAVSFTDRSLKPNVNLAIQQVNGTISGLSSEQLQHADVNLAAKVDGVGPVAITGTINPFSGTQTNDVKISVKDVDLTPTSPYSGKFAGYRIAEGKLNMDLAYELVGEKLQSKNVITLDQFTFGEKVASPDATHLPVRLAVAILKDRDGKIVLDVPIEGSLDDPKFRIGKVVTRAIVNILEKVATSPFSVLGAMFGGGGEELGYQDFTAGSADLLPADRQKLDTLAKALYARPALQLEISGSVDPDADREGLQRAALDREIRSKIWTTLRESERATNSVDQIVLAPDERAHWVKKLYGEAVADGKITPQLIAAHTNLAAYAATVLPHRPATVKGATMLVKSGRTAKAQPAAGTAYQTKLVPPPDPMEAVLLATFPIGENDLQTLAASRAKAVRAYLLQTGKVEATRLFLKEDQTAGLRSDGSRVYLQFR
ncbi:MAG: DUF748 domain-containing protein [Verrucomicrobiota bacterium]|jgi:hypothetical protein